MSADDLKPRQRVVLTFVADWIAARGYPPSTREIATACGLASANGAARVLARLEALGYIERRPGQARGITLRVPASPTPRVPARTTLLLHRTGIALERAQLVTLARISARAPDLDAGERLARLALERISQLRALEHAANEASRIAPPLDEPTCARLRAFERRLASHLRGVRTWEAWLAHEELMSTMTVTALDPARLTVAAPGAVALAEQTRTAARHCLTFARHELARARARARDVSRFDRTLRTARAGTTAVVADAVALTDQARSSCHR